MREILFRGKRLGNGEWVEGCVNVMQNGDAYICHYSQQSPVEANTVGQFTGLTDKNGKKIFEGDIFDHMAVYGKVILRDGMFTLNTSACKSFGGHAQPLCYVNLLLGEVIGNIHDNPELLEDKPNDH